MITLRNEIKVSNHKLASKNVITVSIVLYSTYPACITYAVYIE